MILINKYGFRSETVSGGKAKYIINEFDNGVVLIYKLTMHDTFLSDLKMVRKWKGYYVYKEIMAIKATTLHFIYKNLVDTIKGNGLELKNIL